MLENVGNNRERGSLNMRWIDSLNLSVGLFFKNFIGILLHYGLAMQLVLRIAVWVRMQLLEGFSEHFSCFLILMRISMFPHPKPQIELMIIRIYHVFCFLQDSMWHFCLSISYIVCSINFPSGKIKNIYLGTFFLPILFGLRT